MTKNKKLVVYVSDDTYNYLNKFCFLYNDLIVKENPLNKKTFTKTKKTSVSKLCQCAINDFILCKCSPFAENHFKKS